MTAPTRPAFRYHGGKWRIAPKLLALFPTHDCYVEAFGGAGSVLMRKPRARSEIYNDLSDEVVNVFQVLRNADQAERLRRALTLTPFARREFEAAYADSNDPVERARRAIVRAFMGFGSASFTAGHGTGFRAKSRGSNATGPLDWSTYPEQIPAYVDRLRGVVVEHRDALALIPQHDGPDTLFYVDPPYPLAVRSPDAMSGVRQRYQHEMTDDDHRALGEVLRSVEGMVVLSGRPCALYHEELFPDWDWHAFEVLDDGARRRVEVVWLNPACSAALRLSQAQGELLAAGGA